MLRYHTFDDRGFPTRVRWWEGKEGRLRGAGVARFMWRVLGPTGPALPALGIVAVVAALCALVLSQGPIVLAAAVFSPIVSLMIFILIGLGLGLAAGAGLRRAAGRAKTELLMEGRCPACLYELGSVEPAPDGHHVCPECAAAWDLRRAGKPEYVVVRASDRA